MKSKSDFPNLNLKRAEGIGPNGKPYRVMVVDDKQIQRKQIKQIFESESYDVVETAANGREALEKFDKLKGKLDFVTTTLDMPELDGYALIYELKQKPKTPMIIFISEDTSKGVMQDLISMGIADFILKPINRRVILQRVKAAISKIKQPDF